MRGRYIRKCLRKKGNKNNTWEEELKGEGEGERKEQKHELKVDEIDRLHVIPEETKNTMRTMMLMMIRREEDVLYIRLLPRKTAVVKPRLVKKTNKKSNE